MSDKMFYENLSKQMQEDKEKIKQLEEEIEKTIKSYTEESALRHEIDLKLDIAKTQQKEFIEYMEKQIIDSKAGSGQQFYYQQILAMYKDIVGDSNE